MKKPVCICCLLQHPDEFVYKMFETNSLRVYNLAEFCDTHFKLFLNYREEIMKMEDDDE